MIFFLPVHFDCDETNRCPQCTIVGTEFDFFFVKKSLKNFFNEKSKMKILPKFFVDGEDNVNVEEYTEPLLL